MTWHLLSVLASPAARSCSCTVFNQSAERELGLRAQSLIRHQAERRRNEKLRRDGETCNLSEGGQGWSDFRVSVNGSFARLWETGKVRTVNDCGSRDEGMMCTDTQREGGHVHTVGVIAQAKETGLDGANDTGLDGNPVLV